MRHVPDPKLNEKAMKIAQIFALFDKDDMSGDETDDEATKQYQEKTVRRVRKAWVDESISSLWRFVDSNYRDISRAHRPRGNGPHRRLWESLKIDNEAQPKPRLPANFYNANVYAGKKLATLSPGPEREIPIVSTISWYPTALVTSVQV